MARLASRRGESPPDLATALAQVDASPTQLTGPHLPQHGVLAPQRLLPVRQVDGREGAQLWVVGAHGGAGESTLAGLGQGWQAAGHCWTVPAAWGQRVPCLLTARTNHAGLHAGQQALQQWAAWDKTQLCPQLLGLVLLADAPGKLPMPLHDYARLVGGGAPRVWHIGWVDAWRYEDPTPTNTPREATRLVSTVQKLIAEHDVLSYP